MKPSLDGCITKIDRAKEHIHSIHDQITAGTIKIDPRSIRAQYQFQPRIGTSEVVFGIAGAAPDVPLVFSILAGEAVYQLRSALDHLAYQLVIAHTKKPPSFRSAFPVVGRGRTVKGIERSAAQEYAAETSRLKEAISSAAETMIKDLQPYKRGAAYHADPLWILNELSNIDKHRTLHLTVHRVSSYAVTVAARGQIFNAVFQPDVRFEDGAELGRIMLQNGVFLQNREVTVDGDLTVAVAFDQICGERNVPVIPRLTNLADYVNGIVKAFMCLPEWGWTVAWPLEFPPKWNSSGDG